MRYASVLSLNSIRRSKREKISERKKIENLQVQFNAGVGFSLLFVLEDKFGIPKRVDGPAAGVNNYIQNYHFSCRLIVFEF